MEIQKCHFLLLQHTIIHVDCLLAVPKCCLYFIMAAAVLQRCVWFLVKGFDAAKHWLAVSSILLIIGAASVAVPLALRVAASKYSSNVFMFVYQHLYFFYNLCLILLNKSVRTFLKPIIKNV